MNNRYIFIIILFLLSIESYSKDSASLLDCKNCDEIYAEGNDVISSDGPLIKTEKTRKIEIRDNTAREKSIITNKKILIDIIIGIFITTIGGVLSLYIFKKKRENRNKS